MICGWSGILGDPKVVVVDLRQSDGQAKELLCLHERPRELILDVRPSNWASGVAAAKPGCRSKLRWRN